MVEKSKETCLFIAATSAVVFAITTASSVVMYFSKRYVLFLANALISLVNWNVMINYAKKWLYYKNK